MLFRKTLLISFLLTVSVFNYSIPVNSKIFFLEADYYQDKTQVRKIILGRGEIISTDKAIGRAAVSDPTICDLQALNEKQIFVRAKQLGTSTILIWEKDATIPTRFDVSVWPDIEFLTKQLQELDADIKVDYIPPISSITQSSTSNQGGASGGTEGLTGLASGLSGGGAAQAPSSQASGSQASGSSNTQPTTGKIILKGSVSNAELIARALQIAGAYVGDQGIKIISQPGGQIVDGLAGNYKIDTNTDSQQQQSQGSATAFGARDPVRFTTNRFANLSRGIIVTTQKGMVISFLKVRNDVQISIVIRFYEISRSLARNLGLNGTIGGSTVQGGTFVGGNGISQAIGGISSIANLMSFMAQTGQSPAEFELNHGSIAGGSFLAQSIGQGVTGVIFNPDNGIGAVIQALQERGEIKTLAEPNLVITNGEPATFLAGGEVPIVRSVFTAGGASQDVSYEPFGIRFSLLPTVTSEDKIYLQLAPEIRDIDTDLSNLVVPPGSTAIRPPAFRTRRTQTQVELFSGQALSISGLLREDNTRNLRKVPGIGDIPILGSLFRSKSFRKGESELLIVVSPTIVKPLKPEEIAELKKTEDVPYHEFDQFPPFKKYKKFEDEKGPDDKDPIDANQYNKAKEEKKSEVKQEPSINNLKQKEEGQAPKSVISEESSPKKINKKLQFKPFNFERKKIGIKPKNNKNKEKKVSEKQKSIQREKELNEMWQKESIKFQEAKEAMKLARKGKF